MLAELYMQYIQEERTAECPAYFSSDEEYQSIRFQVDPIKESTTHGQ